MNHRNVLQCYGLCWNFGPFPGLVIPFCENGNILQYLSRHPDVDRVQLLIEVSAGLQYLHSNDVVHGDLRACNILIDQQGTPRLSDTGLCYVLSEADFTRISTGGVCRWTAPEVLLDESIEIPFTSRSDIYAFGMTILEVFTGQIPFHHIRQDSAVIFAVIGGARPHRSEGQMDDSIWEIIESCWATNPKDRPNASVVHRWLSCILSQQLFAHPGF
ncbi:kinase-like protein [Neolentinus lepideus HHB14362 ss-1]|uniref:Kinase-like protein n=1 Tax=Neolentinus lepideus HHB14362 ss-1 TaxID=1314782 RepID=A0A165VUX3_9AGAM|nr:kinase-like protein [Neolentinus lepideus HHB14362 ss-1]